MEKFIITIDSSCDMPEEELSKLNIKKIFMNYFCEDKIYSSNMQKEDYKNFYKQMQEGKVFKTSQVNVQEYINFFEPLVMEGHKNILHISLGSGLSNTINNVFIANDMLKDTYPDVNIVPIDSKIASLGVFVVANEAYKYQQEGKTIEEAATLLNEFVRHVNTYFTTDDLKYFARGGRLSKVSAFVGNAFRINPILDCLPDGQLRVVKSVRGKRNATEYVLDRIANTVIEPEKQILYVCNADASDRAVDLANRIMDRFHFKNYKIYPMGPIIGAHAGPGLLAIFYTGSTRQVEIVHNKNIKKETSKIKEQSRSKI